MICPMMSNNDIKVECWENGCGMYIRSQDFCVYTSIAISLSALADDIANIRETIGNSHYRNQKL